MTSEVKWHDLRAARPLTSAGRAVGKVPRRQALLKVLRRQALLRVPRWQALLWELAQKSAGLGFMDSRN